jgi:radical SAM protein with 4Fe4S-binding SPASM domain
VRLNVVDYGKAEEQKMAVYREWVHLVDQITMSALVLPNNTIGNRKNYSKCNKTSTPPLFCEVPFHEMTISWDGKVTACERDYAFKMALGDATKVPIKHIWNGKKFQALRKSALTNTFPVGSPCYRCEFWQMRFEPRTQLILDGEAKVMSGGIYTVIQKTSQSHIPSKSALLPTRTETKKKK